MTSSPAPRMASIPSTLAAVDTPLSAMNRAVPSTRRRRRASATGTAARPARTSAAAASAMASRSYSEDRALAAARATATSTSSLKTLPLEDPPRRVLAYPLAAADAAWSRASPPTPCSLRSPSINSRCVRPFPTAGSGKPALPGDDLRDTRGTSDNP